MSDIKIIRLDPSRWQDSKRLRLEALKTDPIAFGSSYEESARFEDAIWQSVSYLDMRVRLI